MGTGAAKMAPNVTAAEQTTMRQSHCHPRSRAALLKGSIFA
jgi:hypothetical protein